MAQHTVAAIPPTPPGSGSSGGGGGGGGSLAATTRDVQVAIGTMFGEVAAVGGAVAGACLCLSSCLLLVDGSPLGGRVCMVTTTPGCLDSEQDHPKAEHLCADSSECMW